MCSFALRPKPFAFGRRATERRPVANSHCGLRNLRFNGSLYLWPASDVKILRALTLPPCELVYERNMPDSFRRWRKPLLAELSFVCHLTGTNLCTLSPLKTSPV